MKSLLLSCVFGLALGSTASAQAGRTMRVQAPAVLGQTALFAMQHPVSAAGNLYLFLWSPPFAGAVPFTLPGFNVHGLARVDVANAMIAATGILNSSGLTPDFAVAVPNAVPLVGFAWDLQSVDLDAAMHTTFADDDLAMRVAAPPLPSANMLPIQVGTFLMGSTAPAGPPYYSGGGESPVHQVTISRPFWMGRHEVTQAEYQAIVGTNPSAHVGANLPVESVSWWNAVAYCDALTLVEAAAGRLPTGYEYRLPTEAEWEYCCRAGTTTEFSTGSSLLCGQACFGYSFHSSTYCQVLTSATVGSYPANAFGLQDMHGNVWEWCLDGWNNTSNYTSGAVIDPYVPSASAPSRVIRGGSYGGGSYYCRSARRGGDAPTILWANIGFRVVCAPVLP